MMRFGTAASLRLLLAQALCFMTLMVIAAAPVRAQSADDRPWEMVSARLVIDPFDGNSIDWDKLEQDRAVKGVLHRAYFGTRKDAKVDVRIAEAKRRGFGTGLYLLGRPGDPIAQADLLIALGKKLGVETLALDIEDMSSASMSLADAQRFIARIIEGTGKAPLFYTNFSTYRHVSSKFGAGSAFAKCPLWIARFRSSHGMDSAKVWQSYTLWQFQSEINCKPGQACFRRAGGTRSDMDVNIFRGTDEAFRALFGGSR